MWGEILPPFLSHDATQILRGKTFSNSLCASWTLLHRTSSGIKTQIFLSPSFSSIPTLPPSPTSPSFLLPLTPILHLAHKEVMKTQEYWLKKKVPAKKAESFHSHPYSLSLHLTWLLPAQQSHISSEVIPFECESVRSSLFIIVPSCSCRIFIILHLTRVSACLSI